MFQTCIAFPSTKICLSFWYLSSPTFPYQFFLSNSWFNVAQSNSCSEFPHYWYRRVKNATPYCSAYLSTSISSSWGSANGLILISLLKSNHKVCFSSSVSLLSKSAMDVPSIWSLHREVLSNVLQSPRSSEGTPCQYNYDFL